MVRPLEKGLPLTLDDHDAAAAVNRLIQFNVPPNQVWELIAAEAVNNTAVRGLVHMGVTLREGIGTAFFTNNFDAINGVGSAKWQGTIFARQLVLCYFYGVVALDDVAFVIQYYETPVKEYL